MEASSSAADTAEEIDDAGPLPVFKRGVHSQSSAYQLVHFG